jgi:diguanylate cyclase (GGDEF)-like protein
MSLVAVKSESQQKEAPSFSVELTHDLHLLTTAKADDFDLQFANHCWLLSRRGQATASLPVAQEYLKHLTAHRPEPRAIALVLGALSEMHYALAEDSAGFGFASRGLEAAMSMATPQDTAVLARGNIALGFCEGRLGMLNEAMQRAARAYQLAHQANEPFTMVYSNILFAENFWRMGGPNEALAHSRKALEIARQAQLPVLIAAAKFSIADDLENIARAAFHRKAVDAPVLAAQAEVSLLDSIQTSKELGLLNWQALSETMLGNMLAVQDRIDEALQLVRQAQITAQAAFARTALARSQYVLSKIHIKRGDIDEAKRTAQVGLEMGYRLNHGTSIREGNQMMCQIAEMLGDKDLLVQHLRATITSYERSRINQIESFKAFRLASMQAAETKEQLRRTESELRSLRDSNQSLLSSAATLLESTQRDVLTGLSNRRHFIEVASEMLQKNSSNVYLVFIDIDRFKRINDTFGHQIGDEVLVKIAAILREQTRPDDLASRLAGDEFVLLLPNLEPAVAQQICERLVQRVASYDWSQLAGGLAVTISAGLAKATPESTPGGLVQSADEAAYQAKASGRNRVVAGWQSSAD